MRGKEIREKIAVFGSARSTFPSFTAIACLSTITADVPSPKEINSSPGSNETGEASARYACAWQRVVDLRLYSITVAETLQSGGASGIISMQFNGHRNGRPHGQSATRIVAEIMGPGLTRSSSSFGVLVFFFLSNPRSVILLRVYRSPRKYVGSKSQDKHFIINNKNEIFPILRSPGSHQNFSEC